MTTRKVITIHAREHGGTLIFRVWNGLKEAYETNGLPAAGVFKWLMVQCMVENIQPASVIDLRDLGLADLTQKITELYDLCDGFAKRALGIAERTGDSADEQADLLDEETWLDGQPVVAAF